MGCAGSTPNTAVDVPVEEMVAVGAEAHVDLRPARQRPQHHHHSHQSPQRPHAHHHSAAASGRSAADLAGTVSFEPETVAAAVASPRSVLGASTSVAILGTPGFCASAGDEHNPSGNSRRSLNSTGAVGRNDSTSTIRLLTSDPVGAQAAGFLPVEALLLDAAASAARRDIHHHSTPSSSALVRRYHPSPSGRIVSSRPTPSTLANSRTPRTLPTTASLRGTGDAALLPLVTPRPANHDTTAPPLAHTGSAGAVMGRRRTITGEEEDDDLDNMPELSPAVNPFVCCAAFQRPSVPFTDEDSDEARAAAVEAWLNDTRVHSVDDT